MKRITGLGVLASIILSSCGPDANEIAQTVAVESEKVAQRIVAETAKFESKVALAVEETQTAQPTSTETETPTVTNTESPTASKTITSSPTHTQTFTPTQTATASPTDTPTATATMTPTATATPKPLARVNVAWGNLRFGPGTVYGVVAKLEEGTELVPLERYEDAGWFRVEVEGSGAQGWISATIVDINLAASTLPVAEVIPPTPTAMPTPTQVPTNTPGVLPEEVATSQHVVQPSEPPMLDKLYIVMMRVGISQTGIKAYANERGMTFEDAVNQLWVLYVR